MNPESEFDMNTEFGLPGNATRRVMFALDIARECSDAFSNPKIEAILREALNRIWLKLLTIRSYVMTRNEFAVFNFFQDLNLDSTMAEIATRARAIYWDQTYGNSQG